MISRLVDWCVPDSALRWGRLTWGWPSGEAADRAARQARFVTGGLISTAEAARRAAMVVERIHPVDRQAVRTSADIWREWNENGYFDRHGVMRFKDE